MLVASTLLLATALALAAPVDPRQTDIGLDATSSDPRAALMGSDTYYHPSAVKACLRMVPFRQDVRENIMASLTALNTLNVFQYNQLGEDDLTLNQGVDLRKEFERINETDYSSDYEFQKDLTAAINSLNDGHFYWQNCYDSVFATTSFLPIVALQERGSDDTAIYLAPNYPIYADSNGLSEAFANLGYNLSELAGARVTSIEGHSSWDYLDHVAGPAVGTYQDPEQRVNFQLASYTSIHGGFGITPGGSPRQLRSIRTTSPCREEGWRFQSAEAFYNATCLFQQSPASGAIGDGAFSSGGASSGPETEQLTKEAISTRPQTGSIDIESVIQQAYTLCPVELAAPKYQYTNHPQNSRAYLGGRDIQFYALGDDQRTGVMFVPTFGPMDASTNQPSIPCTNRFVADLYLCFRNFTSAGVEKILIDTSNNGGGQVVLNQFLQRYITGEQYEAGLNFDTVLRKSPLVEGLLKANIVNASAETVNNVFYPGKYRRGAQQVSADEDVFDPGNSYTVNGETLQTSNLLQDSIQAIDQFEGPLNISDTPPFSPAEIVFTGNGLCGSACSSFTNFLIEYYNATAYIAAPRPQNPIEFQAFAAGQATTSKDVLEEAVSVDYTDYATLPPLQVPGTLGLTIRGAISPRIAPGTFLQYRSYPAQKTYGLTAEQFLGPIVNWKYVASQAFG